MFALLPVIWNVIGGGFAKYWKILVPVILVAVALLYVNHLRTQHIKDQAQIKEDATIIVDWSTKFGTLEKDAAEAEQICKDTIAKQNDAVDAISAQAEKYKVAAANASKANGILKKKYESKLQEILNGVKPKDDHASIQYLIDFAKNAGKWEEPTHE